MPFVSEPFVDLTKGAEDQPDMEMLVWEFMVQYQQTNTMPPTLGEIAEVLPNKWRSSAKHYVLQLERRGWVEADPNLEPGQARRYRALHTPNQPRDRDEDLPFTSQVFGSSIA